MPRRALALLVHAALCAALQVTHRTFALRTEGDAALSGANCEPAARRKAPAYVAVPPLGLQARGFVEQTRCVRHAPLFSARAPFTADTGAAARGVALGAGSILLESSRSADGSVAWSGVATAAGRMRVGADGGVAVEVVAMFDHKKIIKMTAGSSGSVPLAPLALHGGLFAIEAAGWRTEGMKLNTTGLANMPATVAKTQDEYTAMGSAAHVAVRGVPLRDVTLALHGNETADGSVVWSGTLSGTLSHGATTAKLTVVMAENKFGALAGKLSVSAEGVEFSGQIDVEGEQAECQAVAAVGALRLGDVAVGGTLEHFRCAGAAKVYRITGSVAEYAYKGMVLKGVEVEATATRGADGALVWSGWVEGSVDVFGVEAGARLDFAEGRLGDLAVTATLAEPLGPVQAGQLVVRYDAETQQLFGYNEVTITTGNWEATAVVSVAADVRSGAVDVELSTDARTPDGRAGPLAVTLFGAALAPAAVRLHGARDAAGAYRWTGTAGGTLRVDTVLVSVEAAFEDNEFAALAGACRLEHDGVVVEGTLRVFAGDAPHRYVQGTATLRHAGLALPATLTTSNGEAPVLEAYAPDAQLGDLELRECAVRLLLTGAGWRGKLTASVEKADNRFYEQGMLEMDDPHRPHATAAVTVHIRNRLFIGKVRAPYFAGCDGGVHGAFEATLMVPQVGRLDATGETQVMVRPGCLWDVTLEGSGTLHIQGPVAIARIVSLSTLPGSTREQMGSRKWDGVLSTAGVRQRITTTGTGFEGIAYWATTQNNLAVARLVDTATCRGVGHFEMRRLAGISDFVVPFDVMLPDGCATNAPQDWTIQALAGEDLVLHFGPRALRATNVHLSLVKRREPGGSFVHHVALRGRLGGGVPDVNVSFSLAASQNSKSPRVEAVPWHPGSVTPRSLLRAVMGVYPLAAGSVVHTQLRDARPNAGAATFTLGARPELTLEGPAKVLWASCGVSLAVRHTAAGWLTAVGASCLGELPSGHPHSLVGAARAAVDELRPTDVDVMAATGGAAWGTFAAAKRGVWIRMTVGTAAGTVLHQLVNTALQKLLPSAPVSVAGHLGSAEELLLAAAPTGAVQVREDLALDAVLQIRATAAAVTVGLRAAADLTTHGTPVRLDAWLAADAAQPQLQGSARLAHGAGAWEGPFGTAGVSIEAPLAGTARITADLQPAVAVAGTAHVGGLGASCRVVFDAADLARSALVVEGSGSLAAVVRTLAGCGARCTVGVERTLHAAVRYTFRANPNAAAVAADGETLLPGKWLTADDVEVGHGVSGRLNVSITPDGAQGTLRVPQAVLWGTLALSAADAPQAGPTLHVVLRAAERLLRLRGQTALYGEEVDVDAALDDSGLRAEFTLEPNDLPCRVVLSADADMPAPQLRASVASSAHAALTAGAQAAADALGSAASAALSSAAEAADAAALRAAAAREAAAGAPTFVALRALLGDVSSAKAACEAAQQQCEAAAGVPALWTCAQARACWEDWAATVAAKEAIDEAEQHADTAAAASAVSAAARSALVAHGQREAHVRDVHHAVSAAVSAAAVAVLDVAWEAEAASPAPPAWVSARLRVAGKELRRRVRGTPSLGGVRTLLASAAADAVANAALRRVNTTGFPAVAISECATVDAGAALGLGCPDGRGMNSFRVGRYGCATGSVSAVASCGALGVVASRGSGLCRQVASICLAGSSLLVDDALGGCGARVLTGWELRRDAQCDGGVRVVYTCCPLNPLYAAALTEVNTVSSRCVAVGAVSAAGLAGLAPQCDAGELLRGWVLERCGAADGLARVSAECHAHARAEFLVEPAGCVAVAAAGVEALDGAQVGCANGGAVHAVDMGEWGCADGVSEMRHKVWCMDAKLAVDETACTEKQTACKATNGSLAALVGHSLECGAGAALTRYTLVGCAGEEGKRYAYTCCAVVEEVTVVASYAGRCVAMAAESVEQLSEHPLRCPHGAALNGWRVAECAAAADGTLHRVEHTCVSPPPPAQSSCRVDGVEGLCFDRDECEAGGGTASPGYCPGAANVQCCLGGGAPLCRVVGEVVGQCVAADACAASGGTVAATAQCPGAPALQCCAAELRPVACGRDTDPDLQVCIFTGSALRALADGCVAQGASGSGPFFEEAQQGGVLVEVGLPGAPPFLLSTWDAARVWCRQGGVAEVTFAASPSRVVVRSLDGLPVTYDVAVDKMHITAGTGEHHDVQWNGDLLDATFEAPRRASSGGDPDAGTGDDSNGDSDNGGAGDNDSDNGADEPEPPAESEGAADVEAALDSNGVRDEAALAGIDPLAGDATPPSWVGGVLVAFGDGALGAPLTKETLLPQLKFAVTKAARLAGFVETRVWVELPAVADVAADVLADALALDVPALLSFTQTGVPFFDGTIPDPRTCPFGTLSEKYSVSLPGVETALRVQEAQLNPCAYMAHVLLDVEPSPFLSLTAGIGDSPDTTVSVLGLGVRGLKATVKGVQDAGQAGGVLWSGEGSGTVELLGVEVAGRVVFSASKIERVEATVLVDTPGLWVSAQLAVTDEGCSSANGGAAEVRVDALGFEGTGRVAQQDGCAADGAARWVLEVEADAEPELFGLRLSQAKAVVEWGAELSGRVTGLVTVGNSVGLNGTVLFGAGGVTRFEVAGDVVVGPLAAAVDLTAADGLLSGTADVTLAAGNAELPPLHADVAHVYSYTAALAGRPVWAVAGTLPALEVFGIALGEVAFSFDGTFAAGEPDAPDATDAPVEGEATISWAGFVKGSAELMAFASVTLTTLYEDGNLTSLVGDVELAAKGIAFVGRIEVPPTTEDECDVLNANGVLTLDAPPGTGVPPPLWTPTPEVPTPAPLATPAPTPTPAPSLDCLQQLPNGDFSETGGSSDGGFGAAGWIAAGDGADGTVTLRINGDPDTNSNAVELEAWGVDYGVGIRAAVSSSGAPMTFSMRCRRECDSKEESYVGVKLVKADQTDVPFPLAQGLVVLHETVGEKWTPLTQSGLFVPAGDWVLWVYNHRCPCQSACLRRSAWVSSVSLAECPAAALPSRKAKVLAPPPLPAYLRIGAFSSGSQAPHAAKHAFDSSGSPFVSVVGMSPVFLGYTYAQLRVVTGYSIRVAALEGTHTPRTFALQGVDERGEWTDIHAQRGVGDARWREAHNMLSFAVNATECTAYRLHVRDDNGRQRGVTSVAIAELHFTFRRLTQDARDSRVVLRDRERERRQRARTALVQEAEGVVFSASVAYQKCVALGEKRYDVEGSMEGALIIFGVRITNIAVDMAGLAVLNETQQPATQWQGNVSATAELFGVSTSAQLAFFDGALQHLHVTTTFSSMGGALRATVAFIYYTDKECEGTVDATLKIGDNDPLQVSGKMYYIAATGVMRIDATLQLGFDGWMSYSAVKVLLVSSGGSPQGKLADQTWSGTVQVRLGSVWSSFQFDGELGTLSTSFFFETKHLTVRATYELGCAGDGTVVLRDLPFGIPALELNVEFTKSCTDPPTDEWQVSGLLTRDGGLLRIPFFGKVIKLSAVNVTVSSDADGAKVAKVEGSFMEVFSLALHIPLPGVNGSDAVLNPESVRLIGTMLLDGAPATAEGFAQRWQGSGSTPQLTAQSVGSAALHDGLRKTGLRSVELEVHLAYAEVVLRGKGTLFGANFAVVVAAQKSGNAWGFAVAFSAAEGGTPEPIDGTVDQVLSDMAPSSFVAAFVTRRMVLGDGSEFETGLTLRLHLSGGSTQAAGTKDRVDKSSSPELGSQLEGTESGMALFARLVSPSEVRLYLELRGRFELIPRRLYVVKMALAFVVKRRAPPEIGFLLQADLTLGSGRHEKVLELVGFVLLSPLGHLKIGLVVDSLEPWREPFGVRGVTIIFPLAVQLELAPSPPTGLVPVGFACTGGVAVGGTTARVALSSSVTDFSQNAFQATITDFDLGEMMLALTGCRACGKIMSWYPLKFKLLHINVNPSMQELVVSIEYVTVRFAPGLQLIVQDMSVFYGLINIDYAELSVTDEGIRAVVQMAVTEWGPITLTDFDDRSIGPSFELALTKSDQFFFISARATVLAQEVGVSINLTSQGIAGALQLHFLGFELDVELIVGGVPGEDFHNEIRATLKAPELVGKLVDAAVEFFDDLNEKQKALFEAADSELRSAQDAVQDASRALSDMIGSWKDRLTRKQNSVRRFRDRLEAKKRKCKKMKCGWRVWKCAKKAACWVQYAALKIAAGVAIAALEVVKGLVEAAAAPFRAAFGLAFGALTTARGVMWSISRGLSAINFVISRVGGLIKNILKIHRLSFVGGLDSRSVTLGFGSDITVVGLRLDFDFEANLNFKSIVKHLSRKAKELLLEQFSLPF